MHPPSNSIHKIVQQKLSGESIHTNNLKFHRIGGGSINETYRIHAGERSFFCKLNSATEFPQLFTKEQNGLTLIRKPNGIRVPQVIDCFEHNDNQILLLEWIQEGERTDAFWKKFGELLAVLHQKFYDRFGLEEDNYMGSVPQSNRQHPAWTSFFLRERIQPMLERCNKKGQLNQLHLRQFESLGKKLKTIFDEEKPSLLHGDLWSGNFMCDQNSEPVLIDPAVYYGHRSVDLAMTTLFGGFRQPFYDAYQYHFPLPSNYKEQWAVCNLYPLLIHLYLFGGSYLPQIEQTLRQFS